MKLKIFASRLLYELAPKYGIKAEIISSQDSLIELSFGGKKELMKQTATRFTNIIQERICDNKLLTINYLKKQRITNVPRNFVIENIDDKRLKTIIFPIVVKPLHGSGGKGVSVGIKNKEELKLAINHAKNYCPQVLIEEQILGHDYRFLVIGEKVFVAKRIPAGVIGDGISTIKELIKTENNIREKQEYNLLSSIKIDLELENTLKNGGYTLDSIPKNHENILLRKNANLSSGGTVIDYTNNIHPENTKLALKIAKKMGMKIIAIDFLFQDVSKKFSKQNGIVIEINSTPGIRLHHPREEEVVENIFKLLFPGIKKKKN